ncbi:MAG: type II toxin-antitoxin system HicA family toxin [Bacteroidales bacterium]|nr:type II toxin-antitoxin system HicA family toxin [Bacteroidales bacterium]
MRGIGCIVTGKQRAGHPEWFSPITGKLFVTSNHLSHEVANGTLKSIKRDSGLE